MPLSPTDNSQNQHSHHHPHAQRRRASHMPVIDQLRNFIRHGKNANADGQRTKRWSLGHKKSSPGTSRSVSPKPEKEVVIDGDDEAEREKTKEAVERIVREERVAGQVLPTYEGLERYELVEKMGDGAFSNVYKAVDKTTGQKVAVKVVRKYELNSAQNGQKHMHPEMKKRPRATERANILKEVQIMRGVHHPNIVELIDFSESTEHYFLILELVGGGELFHRIVRLTYFSEDLARHVIVQVAEGLRYLHEERGVVHRDIKPENLLFDPIPFATHTGDPTSPAAAPVVQGDEDKEDEGRFISGVGGGGVGRVKIADFGLSKVLWDASTATPCGTVGYTAPEIVRDQRYSRAVDMWAMGCVLYTLLCGFPPFYDESIQRLTEKVAKGEYSFLSPWWDPISDSAKDCVEGLLRVDPEERTSIKEFFEHPWIKNMPFTKPGAAIPNPPSVPSTPAPIPSPSSQVAPHTPYDVAEGTTRRGKVTPGVMALRGAFDVSNAVHRVAEEARARRRRKEAGGLGMALMELNDVGTVEEEEEEEDETEDYGEDEYEVVEQTAQSVEPAVASSPEEVGIRNRLAEASIVQPPPPPPEGGPIAVAPGVAESYPYAEPAAKLQAPAKRRNRAGGFELNLDNATLLGRRKAQIGITV